MLGLGFRLCAVYFRFVGMPAQPDQDSFRFRRAAFYSGLKSKVGLIAAKGPSLPLCPSISSRTMSTRNKLVPLVGLFNRDEGGIPEHDVSTMIY